MGHLGLQNKTLPEILVERYVFPIFLASSSKELILHMTCGILIFGGITVLLPFAAPYGRYSSKWAGFGVPVKFAWLLQECPSFFIPVIMIYYGNSSQIFRTLSNKICLGLFVIHYLYRSFIFPTVLQSKTAVPFMPFICAFLTCFYNGIFHGYYFIFYQSYDDSEWLMKPNFWIGLFLFFYGMLVNIGSDSILRNLRNRTTQEYTIPKGGMFRYVSCANYYGEIVEMWGYAIASFAAPALAHASFTTLFLSRRALQHHEWYLKKFDDYPKSRKALIPFVF